MTVKEALKEKNLVIKKINENLEKIYAYNSIDVENKRPYSTDLLLTNVKELTTSLIELKTKIHIANTPVYHKIFEMSELKNLAKRISNIDCSEGKVVDRYTRTEPTVKVAEITVVDRDTIVKDLEEQMKTKNVNEKEKRSMD